MIKFVTQPSAAPSLWELLFFNGSAFTQSPDALCDTSLPVLVIQTGDMFTLYVDGSAVLATSDRTVLRSTLADLGLGISSHYAWE